jgi:hypothetical protein
VLLPVPDSDHGDHRDRRTEGDPPVNREEKHGEMLLARALIHPAKVD